MAAHKSHTCTVCACVAACSTGTFLRWLLHYAGATSKGILVGPKGSDSFTLKMTEAPLAVGAHPVTFFDSRGLDELRTPGNPLQIGRIFRGMFSTKEDMDWVPALEKCVDKGWGGGLITSSLTHTGCNMQIHETPLDAVLFIAEYVDSDSGTEASKLKRFVEELYTVLGKGKLVFGVTHIEKCTVTPSACKSKFATLISAAPDRVLLLEKKEADNLPNYARKEVNNLKRDSALAATSTYLEPDAIADILEELRKVAK